MPCWCCTVQTFAAAQWFLRASPCALAGEQTLNSPRVRGPQWPLGSLGCLLPVIVPLPSRTSTPFKPSAGLLCYNPVASLWCGDICVPKKRMKSNRRIWISLSQTRLFVFWLDSLTIHHTSEILLQPNLLYVSFFIPIVHKQTNRSLWAPGRWRTLNGPVGAPFSEWQSPKGAHQTTHLWWMYSMLKSGSSWSITLASSLCSAASLPSLTAQLCAH